MRDREKELRYMKKMIVILGTILLGVFIVVSLIMSDTGLKGSSQNITNKSKTVIDDILLKVNP